MPQTQTILTPATGAGNSSAFTVSDRPLTVGIYASTGSVTTGSEFADLQRKNAAGNWSDVYDSAGQVRLSAARTEITIVAGGEYRIAKDSTTQTVGVELREAPFGS